MVSDSWMGLTTPIEYTIASTSRQFIDHLKGDCMPSPDTERINTKAVQLHHKGGQVVVTPEDESRFVLASPQAVLACQQSEFKKNYAARFREELLSPLRHWCEQHKDFVHACHISGNALGNCYKVFVISQSQQFDFELSDMIADLETEFEKSDWPCDILQIAPGSPEELRTFFDPQESLQVFPDGKCDTTPEEG